MNLVALPAFEDNYLWLLHDGARALVVDPGDAEPVRDALARLGLQLHGILVTHHHGDHTGGVAALREATGATVYGPAGERIPGPYQALRGGDAVNVLGTAWQVIDVPGHTAGHIAYYAPAVGGAPLLFCGDTLFSGGCGRIFEGTPAQMLASLCKLAALPGDILVCCGHEYTLANAAFALAVEPGNAVLRERAAQARALRDAGQPTLPATLASERACNPFLRSNEAAIRASIETHTGRSLDDDIDAFAELRRWKDGFRA